MKKNMNYKNKRLVSIFIIIVFLFVIIGEDMSNNKLAYAATTGVTTVTDNILTNETVTIVGNASMLYQGANVNAATLTEFKAALNTAISNTADSITINYTGSTQIGVGTMSTLLSSYINDVRQTAGNDYEKCLLYTWTFSYTATSPTFTVTFNFGYLETQQQRDAVNTKVNSILANIITPGMADDQKEKAINDYIVSTIAYDTTLKNHTAYAGLFDKQSTVCQGYALIAYKMLTTAGLNARIITGKGNGGAHAWNLVQVDGNWYQLDCTWNDPLPDVIGRIRYDYFNLTDSQMLLRKHTWTASYYPPAITQYITTDPSILNGGGSANVPTTALLTSDVIISNNYVGKMDTITISNITSGQILKVYKDNNTATLPFYKKAMTTDSAIIPVTQLGVGSGSIYVSVTNPNSFESTRTKIDYSAEPKTAVPSTVVIVNNVDSNYKDTITIPVAKAKDIVKVYSDLELKKLIGSYAVTQAGISATVSLAATKLGVDEGNVYVTFQSQGMHPSDGVKVGYSAELKTATPTAITVYNFNSIKDVVTISGLSQGDVVKIYDAKTGTKILGTAKVKAGKTTVSLYVTQLNQVGGTIYISAKSINMRESERADINYQAE